MWKRISAAMDVPARLWCKLMHPDPMWPVGGYYRCRECLRTYPVQWEMSLQTLPAAATARRIKELRPELPAFAMERTKAARA